MHGRSVSIVLALLVLCAGCGGPIGPSEAPTKTPSTASETPPTPSNWSSPTEGFYADFPENQFLNLSVGSPEEYRPHTYVIGNNGSGARNMTVTVWRDAGVILNRTVSFPGDGVLTIDVYRPGEYTVVFDPANASRSVYAPPPAWSEWDCNHHTHEVLIQPDGRLQAVLKQTALACE